MLYRAVAGSPLAEPTRIVMDCWHLSHSLCGTHGAVADSVPLELCGDKYTAGSTDGNTISVASILRSGSSVLLSGWTPCATCMHPAGGGVSGRDA
ncbi:hypothetical protein STCU_11245 [Strigomonas culicis]|uniref:Uncharacterized protein n=1 Tax=Strigomonas culicis TaxID=28005 RepID=S9V0W5_9TRYP|nr:hypothetical protein STCU_11245 [Strigomonas culicis]|eukprot:EPY16455.1 hypothetical protein STCU_11245 [Strigomonas culicis]